MWIKIINETGVPHQTRIVDAKTGKDIEGVISVTPFPMAANGRGPLEAELIVTVKAFDALVDASVTLSCPHCAEPIVLGKQVETIPDQKAAYIVSGSHAIKIDAYDLDLRPVESSTPLESIYRQAKSDLATIWGAFTRWQQKYQHTPFGRDTQTTADEIGILFSRITLEP